MQRIVVGIDGSEGARRALEWAVAEAQLRDACVIAVHAWVEPAAVAVGSFVTASGAQPEMFEELADRTARDAVASVDTSGVVRGVETRVVAGAAAHTLLEAARDADLVVVGSRGLGGFSGLLLGSVSQQVAHHATCPVVIVPDRR
jgi:nucleotide-binding universal stress UspA family protein